MPDIVVREINNIGAPLTDDTGAPIGGAKIYYTPVDPKTMMPIAFWDAIDKSRVAAVKVTVLTAAEDDPAPGGLKKGEHRVCLRPTSRSNVPVVYLCETEIPGVRSKSSFQAALPEGDLSPLSWADFMAYSQPLTPQELTAVQLLMERVEVIEHGSGHNHANLGVLNELGVDEQGRLTYGDEEVSSGGSVAPGKSAYQEWLDLGNEGTAQEFLNSLKGLNGQNGTDGTDGTDGRDGRDGRDGVPGVVTLADIVAIELAAAPRKAYWVFGGSMDGGTTPDTSVQMSIDALLAAGVPQNNIKWLYEDESAGGVFTVQGVSCTPSMDSSIEMIFQGGIFEVAGCSCVPIMDGSITLIDLNALVFNVADSACAPTMEGPITLVQTGGIFSVAGCSCTPTMDGPVTLTSGTPTSFTDNFNRADGGLGANWSTVPGFSSPSISGNAVTSSPLAVAVCDVMAFADNQYAQVDIASLVGTSRASVVLRGSKLANTEYVLSYGKQAGFCSSTDYDNQADCEEGGETWTPEYNWCAVVKNVAGAYTSLFENDSAPSGIISIHGEIIETTITFKGYNGSEWVTLATITDSSISSGKPGIGVSGSATLDNFIGGNS